MSARFYERICLLPAGLEEQNMLAFENYGNFYYMPIRDVKPREELLGAKGLGSSVQLLFSFQSTTASASCSRTATAARAKQIASCYLYWRRPGKMSRVETPRLTVTDRCTDALTA